MLLRHLRRSEHAREGTRAGADIPPALSLDKPVLPLTQKGDDYSDHAATHHLPSGSSPFLTNKGKKRDDKTQADVTRGTIKLSYISDSLAAVLRSLGFQWITAEPHGR